MAPLIDLAMEGRCDFEMACSALSGSDSIFVKDHSYQ